MFQAPSTAICWCTYEGFKHLLSLQPNLEDKYETLTDLTAGKQTTSESSLAPKNVTNISIAELQLQTK